MAEILVLDSYQVSHDLIKDVTFSTLFLLLIVNLPIMFLNLPISSVFFHLPIVSSDVQARCESKADLPIQSSSICDI